MIYGGDDAKLSTLLNLHGCNLGVIRSNKVSDEIFEVIFLKWILFQQFLGWRAGNLIKAS
jgi:hypothetical protein